MEIAIKRVRFFDGQFLQQLEFNDEQGYHLHMRRRLNYVLFARSGVVQTAPADLTLINIVGQTFRVKAGMAVSVLDDVREGKEVIWRDNDEAHVFDLNALGITTGQAWVTIHYEEVTAKDPPSAGEVDQDTRFEEHAVIIVHSTPPPLKAANGEELILLATIPDVTAIAPVYTVPTSRAVATIRNALIGAGPPPPAPTITGINVASAAQGATVAAVISGTNMTGASAVTFDSPLVTATITSVTPSAVNVTINVATTAPVGARTFTVTTPGGTASSAGVAAAAFQVTAAVVLTVTSVLPTTQGSGNNITIQGTNLRDPTIAVNSPATGTVVQFLDPANTATVRAQGVNVTALPDVLAVQQVRATIPAGAAFTPPQPAGSTTTAKVQVTFAGRAGMWSGTLTIGF